MKERKIFYYTDELNDEFSSAKIVPRTIDENYRYVYGNVFYRFFAAFLYRVIAKPLAFLFMKIRFGWKVKNKKALKSVPKNSAYFLYGNHTSASADPFVPALLTGKKRAYVIVHPANVSIPCMGGINAALGALPLPDTLNATKNFLAAIDTRVKSGAAVCIYPEAHIWPYYTKIRPFKDTSFRYPVQNAAPVFTFTNTYKKRKLFRSPRLVTYIDGPFYPDKTLSAKQAKETLRNAAYEEMKKRSENSDTEYIRYVRKETCAANEPQPEKNKRRYLLFAGNYKVFDGILTCLLSVVKRTKTTEPITALILTMDISYMRKDFTPVTKEQTEFLRGVLKKYNAENEVKTIDVSELYATEFWGCPNEGAYCSPYTLLRLFADKIHEVPDKILYLDADTMFNRDFTLLYDVDVSGVEYAAARDHYGKYILYYNYINAGVLLLNMKMIRETGAFFRARELIKSRKLLFADQSAIVRSTSKKKMLPQKFNDQKFLHKSTVVRHFSKRLFYFPYPHVDNIKQWNVEKVRSVFKYREFDDVLNEYLALKASFEKACAAKTENGAEERRILETESERI